MKPHPNQFVYDLFIYLVPKTRGNEVGRDILTIVTTSNKDIYSCEYNEKT